MKVENSSLLLSEKGRVQGIQGKGNFINNPDYLPVTNLCELDKQYLFMGMMVMIRTF